MERIIFKITKITENGIANVKTNIQSRDDEKAMVAGLASFLYRNKDLMVKIIGINALREADPEYFDRREVNLESLPWENITND